MDMRLEWKDEYASGKPDIDDHNAWLFELFNKLTNVIETDIWSPDIKKYLDELDEFAQLEFHYEEKYLKKLSREIFDKHNSEHEEFRKIIRELRDEIYEEGDISSLYQIVLYLSEWILNHIKYSDHFHLRNIHD